MKQDILKKRFTEVYNSQSDSVFRFCLFRVSSRDNSVDIVQETFMRYWDALISGQEIKNDKAFLFTISRNLIIDYYRKKKSLSLDSLLEEAEDSSSFMEDKGSSLNTEMSADARFVLEKIDELEPSYRQVIYLRFVEGFKPKEIADILNVSSNVVSVRLLRALEKLRSITGFDINN